MMIVVKNDIETGAGAAAKQGVGDDNKQCAPPLANNDSNGNIAGVASSRPCTTARQFLTGRHDRHDRHDRSSSSSKQQQRRRASPWRMSMLIIAIGCLAGTIILAFGIQAARHEQEQNFKAVSGTLFAEFGVALSEYVRAGQWIHQAFRRPTNSSARPRKTLDDFNELYENLVSGGLQFNGVGFGINVSHAERPELENETRLYLQEKYPELAETYTGFLAVGESSLEPRENASFYMIAHYVGSMQAAGHALDVDVYTHPARQKAIDLALATWKPIVTAPLETGHQLNSNIRSVVLVHPGMPLATNPSVVPRDLSLMGIRIPHVIDCARLKLPTETHKISLYVFDSTTESSSELDQGQEPIFLGGATLNANKNKNNAVNTEASSNTGIFINATSNNTLDTQGSLVFASEIALSTLLNKKHCYHDVSRHAIASREWTFLVMAEQDEFAPEGLLYIVLSAVMIFVACTCTALWVYTNHTRLANIHDIQCKAAADKAEFMVESARKAARDERWLNDFISHEIRNPCAAAISACSFVSSAVHEAEPLVSEKARASVREDVKIIETSLSFINDLLRNMLDMHRAASHQLIIDNSYVDILEDILQPVATMLYRRDCLFEVLIDCPPHLICRTDRLRLKQIVINISRNAAKFVHKGFVRFRVETKGGCTNNNNDNESGGVATAGGRGNICIYVEDSGPGIPESKRGKLFEKFQESLDSQNQGTGIGLCVCKHLVELMG
jgi:signal transduction histidine kinase